MRFAILPKRAMALERRSSAQRRRKLVIATFATGSLKRLPLAPIAKKEDRGSKMFKICEIQVASTGFLVTVSFLQREKA